MQVPESSAASTPSPQSVAPRAKPPPRAPREDEYALPVLSEKEKKSYGNFWQRYRRHCEPRDTEPGDTDPKSGHGVVDSYGNSACETRSSCPTVPGARDGSCNGSCDGRRARGSRTGSRGPNSSDSYVACTNSSGSNTCAGTSSANGSDSYVASSSRATECHGRSDPYVPCASSGSSGANTSDSEPGHSSESDVACTSSSSSCADTSDSEP
ncbi:unnamed protein product, partial [Symbiodinium sp. CCMP2456]